MRRGARDAWPIEGEIALFLDVDGTLIDIAPSPEAVTAPPGLVETLSRLEAALGGALALITGRSIAFVDELFAPLKPLAGGVHGAELRLTRGGAPCALAPGIPAGVLAVLSELSRLMPGVLIEAKGAGVSVHYRAAPDAEPSLRRALAALLAEAPGALHLTAGRKLFEILPSGFSKGTAVEAIAASPPFQGRRPIFIGDDVGDEPAFAAVERLGGVSLKVAGEYFQDGEARFKGPGEVRSWLAALAANAAPEPRV